MVYTLYISRWSPSSHGHMILVWYLLDLTYGVRALRYIYNDNEFGLILHDIRLESLN